MVVVNAIQHSVRPAARAVHAGLLAAQRLADAAGFARQVAERELNHGREHPRAQLVQITARGAEALTHLWETLDSIPSGRSIDRH